MCPFCKFKYISCSYLSPGVFVHVLVTLIQIHLMFLFIRDGLTDEQIAKNIQIHLMFLFILHSAHITDFQGNSNTSHVLIYRHRLKRLLLFRNSNTSHVLIYLKTMLFLLCTLTFKYISCSYLSRFSDGKYSVTLSFKYISCSYLSLLHKNY